MMWSKRVRTFSAPLLLILLLAVDNGRAILPEEASTLVLLDNLAIRETHSMFFKSLQERGFKLSYRMADDTALLLSRYGEYLYRNVIIFAPSVVEFGGEISVEALAQFLDDGGNILVAGSSQSGEALHEFASECGFEMDEEGAAVIDHLHFDSVDDAGDHTLILTSSNNFLDSSIIVGNARNGPPLIYQGSGLLADKANPLVLPLLRAEYSAYSYNPNDKITDYPHVVGNNILLIAALQARNNARVVFSGSLYFFSNEAFTKSLQIQTQNNGQEHKGTGNQAASIAISQWVFGERGRLRVSKVNHHKLHDIHPPEHAYTICDPAVYTIQIEELRDDKWLPFVAKDIQMEFVRIDPFVRQTLTHKGGGLYEAQFKIPDVYGVYQFKVKYDRLGYTNVFNTTQVSVRPLEHTQYERFIPSAFPYYSSAFSMMLGVFLFSFVFLHFKDEAITNSGSGSGNVKRDDKKTL